MRLTTFSDYTLRVLVLPGGTDEGLVTIGDIPLPSHNRKTT